MRRIVHTLTAIVSSLFAAGATLAAGTLTPDGSPDQPIQIRDHHVDVVINNGFARTEVTQTFFNPNAADLEGLYAFPIPRDASLSEMSIFIGESELQGEVVSREEAERIYGEEKAAGNDAGLATKETIQRFEFRVSPIHANAETKMRFVYYQPLEIDTGVGRFLYPLEDGGTDDVARSFWAENANVERSFSVNVELKSAVPIDAVRTPGYEGAVVVDRKGEGHLNVRLESLGGSLGQDFLLYYKLAEGLPGRVDLLAHRPDPDEAGHFMVVVTPGIDLKPLSNGADYVFVLDKSGSMNGKIGTLIDGVRRAIGELRPEDRFRVVAFDSSAREIVGEWTSATPENAARALKKVERLTADNGTNLYDGLSLALDDVDADRVTSVLLVTDAVTNTGVIDPREFHKLMQRTDVRIFGFLLGNSGNWPLMRTICDATGGFYAGISNADDVLGQIILAKSKITHEALHDVELEFDGVETFDTTGKQWKKVYRGQQIVFFGRYADGGTTDLDLRMRISGADKVLSTRFEMPEIATEHPEIERLYGLAQVNEIEARVNSGTLEASEGENAIESIGLAYQLVTDETAMLVLDDASFERHGIERENKTRVATERAAQQARSSQPVRSPRVDTQRPMFDQPAPRTGGGAFDPITGGLAIALAAVAAARARNQSSRRCEESAS